MKFLTNLDLSQNEIQNAVIQPLAAAPANPKLGQIYYNSSDSLLYQYDGAKWKPVGKGYFFGYFPELRPTPKGENTHGPKTEQPRKQVEGEVRHHSRQADHLARG